MTLPRFFALAVGLLAVLAALVLALSVRTSTAAVVRVGESSRLARATQIVSALESDLGAAEKAVQDFERALAEGVVDDGDALSVRRYLTAASSSPSSGWSVSSRNTVGEQRGCAKPFHRLPCIFCGGGAVRSVD